MAHWGQEGFISGGTFPAPPEREKRGRTEYFYPAPASSWRRETHDRTIAREAPAAFHANKRQDLNPAQQPTGRDQHLAGAKSKRRGAEAEGGENKLAPGRPAEQPSTGDSKERNMDEARKATAADQGPPSAEGACGHVALQELLRRIIALEFSGRCTQRSIAVVVAICDTLCHTPVAVVKVMEVLDECFADAVESKQQQQLLNYWYVADAVMKLFRDRPSMLNAVVVALPHLLLKYVPWKKSKLAEASWVRRESDEHRYEQLFLTWGRAVPKQLLDEIWSLWESGALPIEAPALNKH
ncbi:hypothetical protein TraAM80_09054 [Trypanosoma rangeli]|uniref:Uncharacterized protein n=1 Tax=Trypanosoma rangeli TaxID=5698 RepID=A0A3R7JZF7_TRYRA|nr:uncharacterized protein TraAM80_09054 [Trypanosoma rangeli]RNE97932.1 hypothetical protein TraAM80_09054 [Trypanosoma rangeli]|eukprot:RNE97932.1 hypothetical protein TraAM80_09054 [Trypanosoma rangeli]